MGALLDKFDSATRVVTDERGADYGHPLFNFDRAARMRVVTAECKDSVLREALEMLVCKMARLVQNPEHLDSWVDIAGYARCAVMVLDKRAEDKRQGELALAV